MQRSLNSRYIISSLVMAIGVTSPLTFTQISWAQAVSQLSAQSSQSNLVLYYGWQAAELADIDPPDADPPETALQIAEATAGAVTFESTPDLSQVADSPHLANSLFVTDLAPSEPAATNLTIQSFDQAASIVAQDVPPPRETEPSDSDSIDSTEVEEVIGDGFRLDGIAPPGTEQTIADIQVRFLDKNGEIEQGHTRPSVFIRQFDLEPGTPYDQVEAQRGLDRILQLDIVSSADLTLEPVGDSNQVTMVVRVQETSPFVFGLGTISPSPAALEGPFQRNPVLGIGPGESTGPSASGYVRLLNLGGNDQSLTFQLEGGSQVVNTELRFTDSWIGDDPTGITVNLFNQRSVQSIFSGGERDIDLPNQNTPWVHRVGAGVEVFRPLSPEWTIALGTSYQQVSIHNSAFESQTYTLDQEGERLIVSDEFDELLTVSLSAELNRFNEQDYPTQGGRFRFGVDQSVPISDAQINFTRFSASYVHLVPLNLFGFAEGPRTLVLGAQAGTMLGDVPPYEAFHLEGEPGIYAAEAIGTGSSFVLLGTEYHFPIANFALLRRDVRLGGALFGGYGSVLGTENEVIGDPSSSRERRGGGFGYGVGLRARTPFGLFRLEFGLNDQGDSAVTLTAGERF